MTRSTAPDSLARYAVLLVALAGSWILAPGGHAQPVEGSTYEQSGKLRFKFKNKFCSTTSDGGACSPDSSRTKFRAEALIRFGPGEGLEPDDFLMAIEFSDGLLLVEGTWEEDAKGKIKVVPDAESLTEQLDALVLGRVEDCGAEVKLKIKEKQGLSRAKSRVAARCKLKGVSPPQKLRVRFRGKGDETLP